MSDKCTKRLGEFSQIFKGMHRYRTGYMECQMVQWNNIKNWVNEGNMESLLSYLPENRYKGISPYMQKDDIVINNLTGELVYIDNDIDSRYVYGESVYVIRVNKQIVDSKYIYILLNAERLEFENILNQCSYSHKIRKGDLENINCLIKSDKERQKIIEEYNMLLNEYMDYKIKLLDIDKKIQNFYRNVDFKE